MILRQRIVSYGIATTALATVVGAALLHPWNRPATTGPSTPLGTTTGRHEPTVQHDVDIVFVVDTTASMGSLLEAAKKTVWSIATHVQSADQSANLRVGLVAFRDMDDDYITKPLPLTSDLDAVAAELYRYAPDGGGDVPENVAAGLDGALRMDWRPGAKRLVFIVGDAEPGNRGDVATFDVLAKQAHNAGITVNTIRCGTDEDAAIAFRKIALLADGDFSSIDANVAVQQIATPYDSKITELSNRIDHSAVIVGGEGARRGYAEKMAATAAAPAATQADRAAYYTKSGHGGAPGKRSADDLVDGVATGAMDLGSIPTAQLPADMQGMDKAAIKAEVDKRVAQRGADAKEMANLVKEREAFIAKQPAPEGGGFDANVKATVDKQLAK